MNTQFSFPKEKIKVVLTENVHLAAVEKLSEDGYSVESLDRALTPDEVIEVTKDAHVLGVRSKTKIPPEAFKSARRLLAVGCFGVGTNQVPLDVARAHGVPVFNAPYSSTRSVAELAIAYILMLSRGVGWRNNKMQQGFWDKAAKGSHEVRHRTLGLIGYGHIGQQVGLMAEALGMNVCFFDKAKKLPLGNASAMESVEQLLAESDFISVHVPALPGGRPFIGANELKKMKQGAALLNLSRGSTVDLAALKEAVESGHLSGAALDVFPVEPKSNKEEFNCEVTGVEKIVMTPHIGGSTEEAQMNIGLEVAESFIKFVDGGATTGAVNFPSVDLPEFPDSHRILNVHKNEPGVMNDVNRIIADLGANINAQYLSTYEDVGYLIVDLGKNVSELVKQRIEELPSNIKTRILY